MRQGQRIAFELLFAALAFGAAAPVWLVAHPPIQDLPQHLAAIRVLVDHGDPALHFADYFDVELLRTQYLAWYLAAYLLAHLVGVQAANTLLLTLALVGTPYALRLLLRELGRDQRLALFVLPLLWNAHLILGFLNFIAAIPLALLGLALAVRLRRGPSRRDEIALGIVALVTFYMHVVPFGFLGLGAGLIAIGEGAKTTLRRWLPLIPATLAALLWSRTSPAGQATLTAALIGGDDGGPSPTFATASQAIREIPMWLTDVLHGEADDRLLVAWAVFVLLCLALGRRRVDGDRTGLASTRRIGLLAPFAALAYFVAPTSYDWIWPISARFPLLALIFLIPVLPAPRRLAAGAVFGGVALVSALSFVAVADAFVTFEEQEVGELDEAIAAIPKGARVAGLIWDRGSSTVKFSPFIHAVAWYQAKRGGAVMFTFADFPQSPIRFREDRRPPKVGPRWEWMPERVRPTQELGWYEYVLARGGPGRIANEPAYEPVFRGPRWSVWKRR